MFDRALVFKLGNKENFQQPLKKKLFRVFLSTFGEEKNLFQSLECSCDTGEISLVTAKKSVVVAPPAHTADC